MKNKIWAVLGYAILLTLMLAPFVFLYYLIMDPVNAIVLAIGAWLWVAFIVFPGILILLILWGFLAVILAFLKSIYELIKSVFK